MTIKDKLHFNYDGIWSDTFNLINVNLEDGLFEETFLASRSIIETEVRGKDKPLFAEADDSPLEFDMVVAFEDGFDNKRIAEVIRWLFQDYYKPLYFEGKENRIYYCMHVDEPTITHNGFGGGYISLRMRCNSPYVYSPVILSGFLDLSVSGKGTIEIFNDGYGYVYPEFSIEKVGAGDILVRNITHVGEEFEINGLTNGEDIYVNAEKRIIETDLTSLGVYRYDSIVGDFPRLMQGKNVLEITGKCKLQLRYQYKYRF